MGFGCVGGVVWIVLVLGGGCSFVFVWCIVWFCLGFVVCGGLVVVVAAYGVMLVVTVCDVALVVSG